MTEPKTQEEFEQKVQDLFKSIFFELSDKNVKMLMIIYECNKSGKN